MTFRVDADVALFAVRHKVEKEYRAYLFLREQAKDRSGYICRNQAAKDLSVFSKQGYSTAQRHIKSLIEMGWITKSGKGNIHINGILRVKALLYDNVEGFYERKRVFYVDCEAKEFYAPSYLIAAFKSALTAGLTQDKLRRNEKKFFKNLTPQERRNKAVIGTALAKDPQARAYAFSIKSQDWAMSIGTVNTRKKISESERYEFYSWNALGNMEFKSEREAVHFGNAHIPNFNRGYLKRKYNTYVVCTGENIRRGSKGIEIGFRNQSTASGASTPHVKLAGKEVILKVNKIKALRAPNAQKNLFITDLRPFMDDFDPFLIDFL